MNADQINAQLTVLAPSIGVLLTALGVSGEVDNAILKILVVSGGPLLILYGFIAQAIANKRSSIMAAAAKPIAPGVAAPQIVLPPQEKDLADSLPANVTSRTLSK